METPTKKSINFQIILRFSYAIFRKKNVLPFEELYIILPQYTPYVLQKVYVLGNIIF